MTQHWIYVIGHEPDFSWDALGVSPGESMSATIWRVVDQHPDEDLTWFLDRRKLSMRPADFVWFYETPGPDLTALGRVVDVLEDDGTARVRVRWEPDATRALQREPLSIDQAIEPYLVDWLRRCKLRAPGGQSPPLSRRDARRKVEREITQRRGGAFRTQLLKAYDNRCAISGCDAADVLEAAHIRPDGSWWPPSFGTPSTWRSRAGSCAFPMIRLSTPTQPCWPSTGRS